MHKVPTLKFQNCYLSPVYYNIFQTSLHLSIQLSVISAVISFRDRPPLNAFDVDAERRERDLNVLV